VSGGVSLAESCNIGWRMGDPKRGRRAQKIAALVAGGALLLAGAAVVLLVSFGRPQPTHISEPATSSPSPTLPRAAPVGLETEISGTWVLDQVMSLSDLRRAEPTIAAGLAIRGVRGFSLRTGWNVIDQSFSLLDAGLAFAETHHAAFSVRFMAGIYTPASVFAAGSPYYTDTDGKRVPLPFTATGDRNAPFESAYDSFVGRLTAWARSNGVKLVHLSNYGEKYSELNYDRQLRSSPGFSVNAFISAEERLANIGLKYAGTDLALELPMSGSGPLLQVVPPIVDYIARADAARHELLIIQANGWGPAGYWSSSAATGHNLDGVFATSVPRALQMIQSGDYDWPVLYAAARQIKAIYVEVYAGSFVGAAKGSLAQQAGAFA
jgi:hypothetical protein